MELFILRHGQAEAYNANDASRQLVERGRNQVAQIVQLSLNDLQFLNQIWVSPYVRAQQTAQIAAGYLNAVQQYSQDLLLPETDPQLLIRQLQASESKSLLLVSHQPLVSRLVDILCGAAPGYHSMGTAALACIDLEVPGAGLGHLRWLRHPSA